MIYFWFILDCIIFIISGVIGGDFKDNKKTLISWILFIIGLGLGLYICALINGGTLN